MAFPVRLASTRGRGSVLALLVAFSLTACTDPGEPADARWNGSATPSPVPGATAPAADGGLTPVAPPFPVVSTSGALAEWPRVVPGVDARAVTSFDRSGGNDDGFAGTHSALYEEGGQHVIFDAFGPGVLRTLWFTSDVDGDGPLRFGKVRFFFDDEASPRFELDANALFSGAHAPFLEPLVAGNQRSSGGFASWVPLTYARRLKITTERRAGFYQAFYETFPADWAVQSTTSGAVDAALATRFEATWFSSLPLQAVPLEHATLGAGTVDVVRFEPDAAPTTEALQSARIRFWFDGATEPQVDAPLGAFFGSGLGEAAIQSAAWTMEPGRYESRFPMPFFEGMRVAVSGLAGTLSLHVGPALADRTSLGTFTAIAREARPTTPGVDHEYARVEGAGKLVATVLTVLPTSPAGKQWWEGDMRTWVDDRATPSVSGTGHEDDHLGGWSNEFLERPFTLPMQGCPKTEILDKPEGGQTNANATMYRLYAGVPFLRGLRHVTEHGPSNAREANYASVAFLYRQPRVRLTKSDEVRAAGPLEGKVLRVRVEDDNEGVKLRRSHAPGVAGQRARVVVDGVTVGEWYRAESNAFASSEDDDYFLPPAITRSKRFLDVTLLPAPTFSVTALEAWSVRP